MGGTLAGECAAAGVHLEPQAGRPGAHVRHGVCHAVLRPSHARPLRDCSQTRVSAHITRNKIWDSIRNIIRGNPF